MLIEESIKDTILRLDNITWFSNCGKKKVISKYDISYAKDIDSAIKHCLSTRWSNITLEKRNDVHSYLVVKRVNTLYTWNEVVLQIKKDILPPILKKIECNWLEIFKNEYVIRQTIESNLLYIMILSAFKKYKEEPFHEELLNIYEQGYFPCGWKGTYPEGKIVIF